MTSDNNNSNRKKLGSTIPDASSNTIDVSVFPQPPTEAQLRLAKLRHKSKARAVKEQVNQLYQTPLFAKDVPNSLADDDLSTVISAGSSTTTASAASRKRAKKRRPKVSRGRRALLRVSQRSYDQRRATIQIHGFYRSKNDANNLEIEEGEEEEKVEDENNRNDNKNEAKSKIATPEGKNTNSTIDNSNNNNKVNSYNRSRRRNTFSNRFMAAQAMLKSVQPSQPKVIRSTKRWKRPKSAYSINADVVTNLDEWQWGMARRKRTGNRGRVASRRMTTTSIPTDRGASWLAHVPARSKDYIPIRYAVANQRSVNADGLSPISIHNDEYGANDLLSPCEIKFEEMVSRMREYDYGGGLYSPVLNRGVVSARYLDQLPKSEPIQSPRVVRRPRFQFDNHASSNDQQEGSESNNKSRNVRRYKTQGQNGEDNEEEEEKFYSSYYDDDETKNPQRNHAQNESHQIYENVHFRKDNDNIEYPTGGKNHEYYYQQKQEEEALRIIQKSRKSGQYQSIPPQQSGDVSAADNNNESRDNKQTPSLKSSPQQQLGSIPEQSFNQNNNQSSNNNSNDPNSLPIGKLKIRFPNWNNGDNNDSANTMNTPTSSTRQLRERGSLFDNVTPLTGSSVDPNRAGSTTPSSSFRAGAAKVAGGLFQKLTGKKPSFSCHTTTASTIASSDVASPNKNSYSRNQKNDKKVTNNSTTSSFRNSPETNHTNDTTTTATHTTVSSDAQRISSFQENQEKNSNNKKGISFRDGYLGMVFRGSNQNPAGKDDNNYESKVTYSDEMIPLDEANFDKDAFNNDPRAYNNRHGVSTLDPPAGFRNSRNYKQNAHDRAASYSAMDPEEQAAFRNGQNNFDGAVYSATDPEQHGTSTRFEDRYQHTDIDSNGFPTLDPSANNDYRTPQQNSPYHNGADYPGMNQSLSSFRGDDEDDDFKALSSFDVTDDERGHSDRNNRQRHRSFNNNIERDELSEGDVYQQQGGARQTGNYGKGSRSYHYDSRQHGFDNMEKPPRDKMGRSDLDPQESFDTQNPSYSEDESPVQSSFSGHAPMSSSPHTEHGRLIESALKIHNDIDRPFIDTDGTTSDASGPKMDAAMAASLLLSPTVLTKRHQQAIRAIERRNWQQIGYLVSANPWLAEMTDVTTEQYLLHKLALYGASKFLWTDDNETVDVVPAASQKLNENLIHLFPSAIHKFDQDGNLPLHMAAASGNVEMAILLGERFPSGASVRNNDGMLPLHLAIQACATPLADTHGEIVSAVDFVALILKLFPGGLAIADSEGDLPLHIAAATLEGEIGVDVAYFLMDQAENEAQSENGLRFVERKKVKTATDESDILDDDDETVDTEAPTNSSNVDDDAIHCNMIRNEFGLTPLTKAIEAGSGWEIIEAIARGPGGVNAALWENADKCNALHLLLSEEYGDPQAALSIIKLAPKATTTRNAEEMLPIEVAARNEMPDEVILAMALVDSPVELTNKLIVKRKEGFGGSWRFLTCESDDRYSDLVEEIVSVCSSHDHVYALCHMDKSILSGATPLCRNVLQRALQVGKGGI